MDKSVYNIVWADDQIDDLLTEDTKEDLRSRGFNIIQCARNGKELENCLNTPSLIDAVIVDANFNESANEVISERMTSGLTYARGLYVHKLGKSIPFFLFTGRSDELLKEVYANNPELLDDFPRNKRWFNKSSYEEFEEMLNAIKQAVDDSKSPKFVIRNRYSRELACAQFLGEDTYEFVFSYLISDYNDQLSEVKEPFVGIRRGLEKMFSSSEVYQLIPPISNDFNGTTYYLTKGVYGIKENETYVSKYRLKDGLTLMPSLLAKSLSYMAGIVQDAAHSKKDLKLKVNDYLKNEDTFLSKAIFFIFLECLKWFGETLTAERKELLWEEIINNENNENNI